MSSKSYKNITAAIFSCVKTISEKEHGTVYDPPDANQGTATTDTAVGKVIVSFDLNPTRACCRTRSRASPSSSRRAPSGTASPTPSMGARRSVGI